MSNNQLLDDTYLKNFAMIIPADVVRRDDGQPAKFIAHKQAFIEYIDKEGRLLELQEMTWAQRDEEYLKWLDTMEIIPASQVKQDDGSILWTREKIIPKQ